MYPRTSLSFWSSCLFHSGARLHTCAAMPAWCSARDQSQGCMNARQALPQPSQILSPSNGFSVCISMGSKCPTPRYSTNRPDSLFWNRSLCFETRSCRTQASLKFYILQRMVLKSLFSCLHHPNVRFTPCAVTSYSESSLGKEEVIGLTRWLIR